MAILQAGFRRWQATGRAPAPIGPFVEERMSALLQANKLAEAKALLDEALKRLNE